MSLLRNFLLSWILSLVSLVSGVATSAASELPDLDPLRFADQIMAFQEWEAKKTLPEGGILFVGSSSIRMRPTAVAFPQKVIINRGFGGAEFPDIFYYYEREAAVVALSKVVLNIEGGGGERGHMESALQGLAGFSEQSNTGVRFGGRERDQRRGCRRRRGRKGRR